MDPLSITASCVSLAAFIAKTSITVTKFVRDVRGARSDLDAVSRELHSLTTVLELLAEDTSDPKSGAFPDALQKQITGIITNCTGVVVEIQVVLDKHEGTQLTKAAKWVAFGSGDVNKLRSSLEAHKSALEIALEMIALTLAREIKADTTEILQDTSEIKEQMTTDTDKIIAEIVRLQEQLPKNPGPASPNTFMLERYLDNLTSYCESTVYDVEEKPERGYGESKRSSLGIDHTSSIASSFRSLNMTSENHNSTKPRSLIDYSSNDPFNKGFNIRLDLEDPTNHETNASSPNDLGSRRQEPLAKDSHQSTSSQSTSQLDIYRGRQQLSHERSSTTPETNEEDGSHTTLTDKSSRQHLSFSPPDKKVEYKDSSDSLGNFDPPQSGELESVPVRIYTPQNRGPEEGQEARSPRWQEPSTQTSTQDTATPNLTSQPEKGLGRKFTDHRINTMLGDDYDEDELHKQGSAETKSGTLTRVSIPNPGQNHVIEFPIGQVITFISPNGRSDPIRRAHFIKYSAITCRPAQFHERGYKLGQILSASTKLPEVVFKLLYHPEDQPESYLLRTLQSLNQSVSELGQSWSRNCAIILSDRNTGSHLHSMGITTVTRNATIPDGINPIMNLFESSVFFDRKDPATNSTYIIFLEPFSYGLQKLSSTPDQWMHSFIQQLKPALEIKVKVGCEVRASTLKDIRNRAAHEVYGRIVRDGRETTVSALYEERHIYRMASKAKGLFGFKA